MLPRSPWEQSFADNENEGVPTEESVAEIFDTVMMEYFSTSQCEHLMLAICMGLQMKMSEIFALETEILNLICSHLFVNTQKKYALCNMHAQWIC